MVGLSSLLPGSKSESKDFDVEAVLSSLSLAEKISLLGGKDFWHTVDIPEKSIPSVRVSDGPNGVRGIQFFNGTPSNCFPCATGLGSSFDVALAQEVGKQLGDECKAKGAHVLLGPTINIQRSPLGGRGFESYSEDPLLSGKMASGYVQGVQGEGVAACLKHFVGNEQEFERFSNDSIIPERALREIYLEPFRIATKEAKPWCYMSSYNRVNGTHVSESKELLDDVLRKEWGWEGMVMSDWTGVYSSEASVKAGLDLEMPGPPVYRGAQTARDVFSGKLQEHHIDDRARQVLKLVKRAMDSGIPFGAQESLIDNDQTRALLRKAAANAIVLLKNDKQVLPIKQAQKIAVIGSNARVAVASGGGSASMLSSYTVTPLEGITAAAKEIGAEVDYAIGSASYLYLPAATKLLSHPSGSAGAKGSDIAQMEFWLQEPSSDFKSTDKAGVKISAKPDHSVATNTANAFMMDGLPAEIAKGEPFIRYTSNFKPDQSGDWEFALGSMGESNLYVDGKLVINNSSNWQPGEMWFNMGSVERRGVVKGLEQGKEYSLEVRCWFKKDLRGSPFKSAGAIRIGALPVVEPAQAIADAVKIAQQADTTIVVVGLNEDFESEGYDRKHMDLPGTSNKLVSAVLAVAPNAIIVNQSGTPVTMPWVDQASTLVQAFYGGNDVGNGLADVLFGKLNPSSKLALSFPKRLADSPAMKVIVTGATGVLGKEIVQQCLNDSRITKVVILTRRAVSMDIESHPKTEVMMHQDFSRYSDDMLRRLEGASACLWAIGGRSDQLESDKDMLHKVTVEFPLAAARAMSERIAAKAPGGNKFNFVFCSSKSPDRHPAKLLFLGDPRRSRGEAEKGLCELADANAVCFSTWILRPGGIIVAPAGGGGGGVGGDAPKKKRLMGSRSSGGVELPQLARAFVKVGYEGWKDRIIDTETLLKM